MPVSPFADPQQQAEEELRQQRQGLRRGLEEELPLAEQAAQAGQYARRNLRYQPEPDYEGQGDPYASRSLVTREFVAGIKDLGTAKDYVDLGLAQLFGNEQDVYRAAQDLRSSQMRSEAWSSPEMKPLSEVSSASDLFKTIAGTIARSAPLMVAGGLGGAGAGLAGGAVTRAAGLATRKLGQEALGSALSTTGRALSSKAGRTAGAALGLGTTMTAENSYEITDPKRRAEWEAAIREDRRQRAWSSPENLVTPIRVIDGDTLLVRDAAGQEQRIRLADANTADEGQVGKEAATQYVQSLIDEGKPLAFVATGDPSRSRLVGHLYREGDAESINEQLLSAGLAAPHGTVATQEEYKRRALENLTSGAVLYDNRFTDQPMSPEAVYTQAREFTGKPDVTLGEILATTTLVSGVQGGLELLPWLHGFSRLKNRFAEGAGSALRSSVARRVLAQGMISGTEETATELTQQVLQHANQAYLDRTGFELTPERKEDYFNTLVAFPVGFLLGGLAGVPAPRRVPPETEAEVEGALKPEPITAGLSRGSIPGNVSSENPPTVPTEESVVLDAFPNGLDEQEITDLSELTANLTPEEAEPLAAEIQRISDATEIRTREQVARILNSKVIPDRDKAETVLQHMDNQLVKLYEDLAGVTPPVSALAQDADQRMEAVKQESWAVLNDPGSSEQVKQEARDRLNQYYQFQHLKKTRNIFANSDVYLSSIGPTDIKAYNYEGALGLEQLSEDNLSDEERAIAAAFDETEQGWQSDALEREKLSLRLWSKPVLGSSPEFQELSKVPGYEWTSLYDQIAQEQGTEAADMEARKRWNMLADFVKQRYMKQRGLEGASMTSDAIARNYMKDLKVFRLTEEEQQKQEASTAGTIDTTIQRLAPYTRPVESVVRAGKGTAQAVEDFRQNPTQENRRKLAGRLAGQGGNYAKTRIPYLAPDGTVKIFDFSDLLLGISRETPLQGQGQVKKLQGRANTIQRAQEIIGGMLASDNAEVRNIGKALLQLGGDLPGITGERPKGLYVQNKPGENVTLDEVLTEFNKTSQPGGEYTGPDVEEMGSNVVDNPALIAEQERVEQLDTIAGQTKRPVTLQEARKQDYKEGEKPDYEAQRKAQYEVIKTLKEAVKKEKNAANRKKLQSLINYSNRKFKLREERNDLYKKLDKVDEKSEQAWLLNVQLGKLNTRMQALDKLIDAGLDKLGKSLSKYEKLPTHLQSVQEALTKYQEVRTGEQQVTEEDEGFRQPQGSPVEVLGRDTRSPAWKNMREKGKRPAPKQVELGGMPQPEMRTREKREAPLAKEKVNKALDKFVQQASKVLKSRLPGVLDTVAWSSQQFQDAQSKGKAGKTVIKDGKVSIYINPKVVKTREGLIATFMHEAGHALGAYIKANMTKDERVTLDLAWQQYLRKNPDVKDTTYNYEEWLANHIGKASIKWVTSASTFRRVLGKFKLAVQALAKAVTAMFNHMYGANLGKTPGIIEDMVERVFADAWLAQAGTTKTEDAVHYSDKEDVSVTSDDVKETVDQLQLTVEEFEKLMTEGKQASKKEQVSQQGGKTSQEKPTSQEKQEFEELVKKKPASSSNQQQATGKKKQGKGKKKQKQAGSKNKGEGKKQTQESAVKAAMEAAKKEIKNLPPGVAKLATRIHEAVYGNKSSDPEAATILANMLSSADLHDRNDAIIAAYHTLLSAKDRRILNQAFNSPAMRRQMRKRLDEETWNSIKDDPAQYMAATYELWRTGKLVPGSKVRLIYELIRDWMGALLGIVSTEAQALDIFTQLSKANDVLARKMVNRRLPLYRDTYLRENLLQTAASHVHNATSFFGGKLWKVLYPTLARLRSKGNPGVRKIIDAFFSDYDEATGATYDINVQTMNATLENLVVDILAGKSEKFIEDWGFSLRTGTKPSDPEVAKAVEETHKYFENLYLYMAEAGVQVGKIRKGYFPRVWDAVYIQNNQEEFIDFLMTYTNVDSRAQAEHITQRIIQEEGVYQPELEYGYNLHMGSTMERPIQYKGPRGEVGSAKGKAQPSKELVNIERIADKFKQKDTLQAMVAYTHKAVRKAEFTRKFGAQGHKLDRMIKEAQFHGLKGEDLEDLYKAIDAQLGIPGSQISPKLQQTMGWIIVLLNYATLGGIMFASLPDLASPFMTSRNDPHAIKKAYAGMLRNVRANLGDQDAKEQMKVLESIGTLENKMFSDLMNLRTGSTFLNAQQRKFNDIFFEVVGIAPYTRMIRRGLTLSAIDFLEHNHTNKTYMQELGLKDGDVTLDKNGKLDLPSSGKQFDMLNSIKPQLEERALLEDLARKIKDREKRLKEESDELSDKQKNRLKSDIKRFKATLKKHGGTKRIKELNRQIAPVQAELDRVMRVRSAIAMYVNRGSIKPGPGVRPTWMNDPRFMLIGYLKDFLYGAYEVFHRQAAHIFRTYGFLSKEMTGALMMFLMMGPLYLIGETARDLVQHGDDDDPGKRGWTEIDHLRNAYIRSGLAAIWELGYDMEEAQAHGHPFYRDLLGPVYARTEDFIKALASNDQGSVTRFAEKLLPLQSLYKDWDIWKED